MPVLFCERCKRETEWIHLGNQAVYCKSCGWQMDINDFRAYRSKILMQEFEKFHEEEQEQCDSLLEAVFTDMKRLVAENKELAEEIHRRNVKWIEKQINKTYGRRRKQQYAIGVKPL